MGLTQSVAVNLINNLVAAIRHVALLTRAHPDPDRAGGEEGREDHDEVSRQWNRGLLDPHPHRLSSLQQSRGLSSRASFKNGGDESASREKSVKTCASNAQASEQHVVNQSQHGKKR